jgi:hypothetical protein
MCKKCNGRHQRFLSDLAPDINGLGKVKKVIKIMTSEDKALIEEARQKMDQLFAVNEQLRKSR